ncbi:MAG: hypothetical protein V1674_03840 [Candidatus Omnitrophota bacterium]
MDIKLESLIEKIKKDGIQEAKKTSKDIIDQAKLEANQIIEQARRQAQDTAREAQKEAQKSKHNTEDSLRQASRDLILVLKEELAHLFDRILKQEISRDLSPEFLKQLITKMIDKWTPKEGVSLEVVLSKKDKEDLEKLLLSSLKTEVKKGIEIKIGQTIDKGFSIGIKGENLYYDFTDESILEALKQFLNPAISEMLNRENG